LGCPEGRQAALAFGGEAEAAVAVCLASEGWEILHRNWRGGGGELDLVVQRGGCLRLVEVKAREPSDPIGLEAVDVGKRARLSRAARAFLTEWNEPYREVCFMVVLAERIDDKWRFTVVDDAFDCAGG